MHSRLTVILAERHIAELRRATDHDRVGQAATTANRSYAPTAGRPITATRVTFIRGLRRRLAQTHPAAR